VPRAALACLLAAVLTVVASSLDSSATDAEPTALDPNIPDIVDTLTNLPTYLVYCIIFHQGIPSCFFNAIFYTVNRILQDL